MLNTPLPRLSTDSISGLSSPTVNWNHTRLRLQNLVFCGANACSDRKVMQLAGLQRSAAMARRRARGAGCRRGGSLRLGPGHSQRRRPGSAARAQSDAKLITRLLEPRGRMRPAKRSQRGVSNPLQLRKTPARDRLCERIERTPRNCHKREDAEHYCERAYGRKPFRTRAAVRSPQVQRRADPPGRPRRTP